MSKKLLLLSPAKSGILVDARSPAEYVRWAMLAAGIAVMLVGAADVTSRLARYTLGDSALFTAFAPAAAIGDPSLTALFSGSPATSTPLTPARLRIPAIGVNAAVEHVGKKADGTMASPQKFAEVGWYALGAKPGAPGNAVIAGHVNNALTTSGVFEHLSDLRVGDYITVEDASGKTLVYVVRGTAQYKTDEAPAASIFSTIGPSQLVLITCDGDWVASAHSFDKRFIVYASLKA